MAYIKPICNCGTDLIFTQEFFYREQWRIGPNGKLFDRRMRQSEDDKYVLYEMLRCPQCLEHYEFEYDELGRIIVVGNIVAGFSTSGHNTSVLRKAT
ncbi:hypothetical protein EHV15_35910 [Paenibacillus oralis]|uniref:Uncharacterized protein n=1 Tax=Paenibacillus oralis TaxID=2490856 RepID=A0A3P3TBR5_9BACL|nr:hypothetical protein [Paenibacillus oralis]RRJ54959.1 hypothetical protein EHV15_35910 [Paenibacillus oralis]